MELVMWIKHQNILVYKSCTSHNIVLSRELCENNNLPLNHNLCERNKSGELVVGCHFSYRYVFGVLQNSSPMSQCFGSWHDPSQVQPRVSCHCPNTNKFSSKKKIMTLLWQTKPLNRSHKNWLLCPIYSFFISI